MLVKLSVKGFNTTRSLFLSLSQSYFLRAVTASLLVLLCFYFSVIRKKLLNPILLNPSIVVALAGSFVQGLFF